MPLSPSEFTLTLLNNDIISGFITPAINNIPSDIADNKLYIANPIIIDLIIFELLLLCPIISPNIPLIIINKHSKNNVITITSIKLNTELFKYIADCSKDSFNITHVSLFRQLIARQITTTTNEVSNVIIAVRIFDK